MPGVHINKRKPGYQSIRGERQMARILDVLTDGPMTSYQIMGRLHMSRKTVHTYLGRLMKKSNRRVYICGYDIERGRPKFMYDLGKHRNVTVAAYQMGRLLSEIGGAKEPISAKQAGIKIGVASNTANRYIVVLRKNEKIHIAKWVWVGTGAMPLYVAGKGEDEPKLSKRPPITRAKHAPARTSIFAALGL